MDATEFARFEERVMAKLAALQTQIGHASDDGKGGTGLTGEVMRTKTRVNDLVDIKKTGVGMVMAVTFLGSILWLGFKALIVGVRHNS